MERVLDFGGGPDTFDESWVYPDGYLPNPLNPVVASTWRPSSTIFPIPGQRVTVVDAPSNSPEQQSDTPGQEAEFRVAMPNLGFNPENEAMDPRDPITYRGGPLTEILNRTGTRAVGPLAAVASGGLILMGLGQIMRGRKKSTRAPKTRVSGNPIKAPVQVAQRVVEEVQETTEDMIETAADIATGNK